MFRENQQVQLELKLKRTYSEVQELQKILHPKVETCLLPQTTIHQVQITNFSQDFKMLNKIPKIDLPEEILNQTIQISLHQIHHLNLRFQQISQYLLDLDPESLMHLQIQTSLRTNFLLEVRAIRIMGNTIHLSLVDQKET